MSDPAYQYDDNGTWTYKDYKNWELKPGERFEIIDGFVYAMSAPNTEHQRISMLLSGEFYSHLKGKTCQPLAAPYDVRLFYEEDESDNTVVQPDLIVVCDPKKLGKEGCRGAPSLVIEILSPSNSAIEINRKLNIYQKAEVPEIWIIDPEEKQINVYLLTGDRYAPQILRKGDTLKPAQFPGFEIALDALFAENI